MAHDANETNLPSRSCGGLVSQRLRHRRSREQGSFFSLPSWSDSDLLQSECYPEILKAAEEFGIEMKSFQTVCQGIFYISWYYKRIDPSMCNGNKGLENEICKSFTNIKYLKAGQNVMSTRGTNCLWKAGCIQLLEVLLL